MKQLIIVIVLVVAGYFAYQHFYGAPSDEAAMEEEEVSGEIETSAVAPPPPIPGSCSGAAKNLEHAIYGSATGQELILPGEKLVAGWPLRSSETVLGEYFVTAFGASFMAGLPSFLIPLSQSSFHINQDVEPDRSYHQ
mgnify:CR=1 FL=1